MTHRKYTEIYTPPEKPLYTISMECGKDKRKRYCLKGEVRDIFIREYPLHTNHHLARLFGVSPRAIRRFAEGLNLVKDKEAVRHEWNVAIRTGGIQSGYYDSKCGKRLPESAVEALRRQRANQPNPMQVFRERNTPDAYEALKQRIVENRKKTVRKERARIIFGLPQRTKLKLTVNPLTEAAFSFKYRLIHIRNYFPDPDHTSRLYYDSETKRSSRLEAKAPKYGLRIVAADE